MNNCKCKRLVGPYGSWSTEELIGAFVRVNSMPVSNFVKGFDSSATYTIKDIYFRVTVDGKTITTITLNECPGMIFTWKDLEIKGIVVKDGKESEQP
jgi:hypothetical protein